MKHHSEELKFGGIKTFMGAPYIDIEQAGGFDVCVVGVPVDYGSSYRQGARNAPRSIREHGNWDRVNGSRYVDIDSGKMFVSNELAIGDLGDVLVSPGDAEKTNQEIIAVVRAMRERTFPLVLGGDHSVTYSSFIGCSSALSDAQKSVGILKFDAHPDVERDYLTLPRVWHGNPFRTLIEEGRLDGNHLVNIGLRGLIPEEWYQYMQTHGITNFTAGDVARRGIDAVISDAIALLRARCASVYVTFDIDCIDPADAPGTGTPMSGGIRAEDAISAVRQLRDLPIVGFDLVEVNPDYDPTGRTQIVSSDLLWNFLSFGLHKKS